MPTAIELGRIRRYVDKGAGNLQNLAPEEILDFTWILIARNREEELADLGLPLPERSGLPVDHHIGQ